MSLHALAGHMAAKGRGSDSMLVHMTPEEVQSLQVLALRAGGSLTINPETGLPEANFLKKMLPMIAGFALGPAGFGLMSAGMAGAAVGGITALSTGSLSRGLMAGLGAYGGAGLAGSLANAGTGALSSEAGNAALANAGLTGEAALSPAADEIAQRAIGERLASATPYDKLSTGFKAVTDSPAAFGNFAKNNIGAGLAAVSAINADEGVQTTTKRPDTGTIRNFTFDPYGQTYSSAGNYPASEYRGMAQGGIVALAAGGVPDKIDQNYVNQLVKEAATQAGGTLSYADAANAAKNLGISEDMLRSAASNTGFITGAPASVAGPAAGSAAYNSMVGNFFGNPNITAADVNSAMSTYGLNQADVTKAMGASGLSNAAQFAAFQPDVGVPNTPMGGLAGLSSNINAALGNFRGVEGRAPTRAEAEAAMALEGYNERDFLRATGMTLDEYFKEKKKPLQPFTPLNPITTATNLPGGVSGGGNTYVNPNGTITTRPNIPGMPEGGFTGMGQLKDVYTQGGGSLGYVNPAPTTMEEFEQRFNRQTGDSLAAYEYLMGRGANPIKSGVGEIMRPYSEAVRGIPAAEGRPTQKYIYQNGRYVENPNYVPVSYNSKGERVVGISTNEVLKGIEPFKTATDDTAMFDWVTENNVTEAQLAAALGISIAEARARLRAAAKAKGITNFTGFYEGGDSAANPDGFSALGSNNAPVSAMGGDTGFGDGSVGPAGGGGDTGDAPGSDGSPGSGAARGGLLPRRMALGGLGALAGGGSASQYNLGSYSDGGRLLRGPGDGVSDSIPATIGGKQPARLADGEFVVPARIVSELGNGSTGAGARKLYAMMDRVQKARGKTTGKNRVAANTRADKYLPA